MKHFKPTELALVIGALFSTPSLMAQQSAPTDVGKIAVEGQGGTGLITQEETPKARSSVSRERLDMLNPSSNPYQAIELLPGVSTFSYDATGLFGGGMRVRGANSDQMGFTINGAPVNDSGSFSVFPQEYTDSENLCEVFLTQGATDTEAPHVGASGGNIGMVTCPPLDKFRVRAAQSLGELRFKKSYLRVDTGKFANDMAKVFISYSHAEVDKFKGPGGALRRHWDFGAEFKPSSDLSFSTSLLYNNALANNIRTLNKTQIATNRDLDFLATPPVHLTPGPGAQTESTPADGYYKFNINPFENYLWTGKAEYKASKDLSFTAEPYFWYGYGTGGGQLQTLTESNASNQIGGGVKDVNGDGDTLDRVMVYGSSLTRTYRPGITLKTNWRFDNHNVLAGYWYERARHIQTGPRVLMDSNGNSADQWLRDEANYLQWQNGSPIQARNWLTVSTGSSLFLQDSISLMQDKAQLQLGLRNSSVRRDFSNFVNLSTPFFPATAGATADVNYKVDKTYSKVLASVGTRYNLTPESHVFFNAAQNFKAPANFSFSPIVVGGTIVNGERTGYTLRDPSVQPETSLNMDIGYRLATDNWTFSGSIFYNDFKNRIATSLNPDTNTRTDFNVGSVTMKGFELETGYKLNANWVLYGSISFTRSEMLDDLAWTSTTVLPTAGKALPDTPRWLSGLSANYANGPVFGSIQAKFQGRVYSTLVNDEQADGYNQVNATLGYKFGSRGFFKNPQIQLNVSNLFNEQYLRINSPSGSSFSTNAITVNGIAGAAPTYYVSAPRFTSVTMRSDF